MPPKGSKKGAKPAPAKEPEQDAPKTEPEADGETKAEEPEKQEPAPAAADESAAEATQEPAKEEPKEPESNGTKTSKKRKATTSEREPSKASRRSIRGAPKSSATPAQLINYLLSPAALDLCRPEDEAQSLSSTPSQRTYSGSQLSPFEELLCAIILSRPISHRLGLRTIRTVLNDPYSFTSPAAILASSPEQRHQAMFDARTQHKDKTATQIGLVAQVISEKFSSNDKDTSLEKVRSEAGKSWDTERDLLQKEIKGLGRTGLDIFFRRVQWLWEEAYPFVDERTARGVEKLGLPKDAEGLRKCIEENWKEISKEGLPKDQAQAKRRVFVVVCERATSADLEGKGEALVEAAAGS